MELFSISDTLFDGLRLEPLTPVEGITYSTNERYMCLVNEEEWRDLHNRCTTLENINSQLGCGKHLYKISYFNTYPQSVLTNGPSTNGLSTGVWHALEVKVYDIYEPDVVRWFDLDWRSPLYLEGATDKILDWIDELYREADRWIRMS